jgi:predicted amidohydrolase YtcJ
MAFQGEYFVDRYGSKAAQRTPPLRRMLEMGVPVRAGTDATRVASYNPFVSLYWMTTGKNLAKAYENIEKNYFNSCDALAERLGNFRR